MNNSKDNEIESRIHELLEENPEDLSEIDKYISEAEEDYSYDIEDFAFREAIRSGATNYVEANASDFDLNDSDGYSSYLYETDDFHMQDILMSHGAFKSWDDYADCDFAYETVNGEILAFDENFQQEAFNKYLEHTGLTREKVVEMLSADYDADEDANLPKEFDSYFFEDHLQALGVSLNEGELYFADKIGDSGAETKELLEELGWNCAFEGDSWKLETIGVYFI